MAKLPRVTLKQFASGAGGSDIGIFGSKAAGSPTYSAVVSTIQSLASWTGGWAQAILAGEVPCLEDQNAVDFVYGYMLSYMLQQGVPEWDTGTVYYTNSICQYNGVLYQSLQDSNQGNTPSTSSSYWAGVVSGESDIICRGFELVYNSINDLKVNPGTLFNGTVKVNTTIQNTLTLATAANWYDGATHTYAGGAGWCYIGVDNAGNIKLLGANPPNRADTVGNSTGTLLYSYITSTYWRVIGAVWVYTNDTITTDGSTPARWFQQGNHVMWDIPVQITTTPSSGAWSSALPCIKGMPATSACGIFGLYYDQTTSQVGIMIRPNSSTWKSNIQSEDATCAYFVSSDSQIAGQRISATDSSQQIQYYTYGAGTTAISVEGYYLNIR